VALRSVAVSDRAAKPSSLLRRSPRIDFGVNGNSYSGGCRGTKRGPNCVNFKPPCEDSWLDVHQTDNSSPKDALDVQGECSGNLKPTHTSSTYASEHSESDVRAERLSEDSVA
jgi:hypothetical protein